MGKVKKIGKERRKWTPEQLEDALSEIRLGKSTNSVSKRFGIPRTTLLSKKSGRVPLKTTFGPAPILSLKDEEEIIRWIVYSNNRGFPVTKTQLIMSAAALIKTQKRKNPFKNGIPGRNWYKAFLRRHPEVANCISRARTIYQSVSSDGVPNQWFSEVQKHLVDNNLTNLDSHRIFNCDECAFYLSPKGDHVLVKKGDKTVHNFVMNDEKECLATLFMTNAAGLLVPPMVLFSYERLPFSINQSFPKDWSIGKTDSGWMTGELFYKYLINVFEPWLKKQGIQRPVVLFLGGHSTYLTMSAVEFCIKEQIQLIALDPNASPSTQPLDVTLFAQLKGVWGEDVRQWCTANQRKIRREDFSELLKASVDKLDLTEIIPNGFKVCGLYPFNPDIIQNDRLVETEVKEVPATNQPVHDVNEFEIAFKIFEQNIDPDILKAFYNCYHSGVWDGEIEQLGLFKMWMKFVSQRQLIKTEAIENDTDDISLFDIKEEMSPNDSDSVDNSVSPVFEEVFFWPEKKE